MKMISCLGILPGRVWLILFANFQIYMRLKCNLVQTKVMLQFCQGYLGASGRVVGALPFALIKIAYYLHELIPFLPCLG